MHFLFSAFATVLAVYCSVLVVRLTALTTPVSGPYKILRRSQSMLRCIPCNRDFPNRRALEQHLLASSRHHYCLTCQRDFDTQDGLMGVSSLRPGTEVLPS